MDNLEITDKQKEIFNYYLKNLALKNKRPYTKRKNFDKLTPEQKITLAKLELFFNRNPEININLYFQAGFEEVDNTFLDLGFFNNIKLVRSYTNYIKRKFDQFVDSPESLRDYIEAIAFIRSFNRKNNIETIKDYFSSTNENGVFYCLIHLKQMKINLYIFHAYNIQLLDINLPEELLNIYLENFKEKFFRTKVQYKKSTKLQILADKIKQKILTE